MKRSALEKFKEIKDTHLENLESEAKEYRVPCGLGLYFRVSPTAKKSWQVRFKDKNEKWKWLSLGAYPNLSLANARLRSAEIFAKLSSNQEVLSQKEIKQKSIEEQRLTFGCLIYDWLDTKKMNWAGKTLEKETQSIEKRLIPVFGHRDFTSITPQDWLLFFQDIQRSEQIFNRVKKLVSHCRCAYDFAKFQGRINHNPLDGITKYLDKGSEGNMKHISIQELPFLIAAIRNYTNPTTAIALELMILLFPRPQELRFSKWQDFDLENKIWTKPADTMKCGIKHLVPLPQQAIDLLIRLKEISPVADYLFPSRDSLSVPISEATLNKALIYMGYGGRQTPHGFRHIASTALNEQFSDKEQVIEACLAHKKQGVKAIYDKATHLDERMEIMQWWACFLG